MSGRTGRAAFQNAIYLTGRLAGATGATARANRPAGVEHLIRCPLDLHLALAFSGHTQPCDLTQEDLCHV